MKVFQIRIAEETYQVVQKFVKINLYQVFSPYGIFEITKNLNNGEWKVLTQDGPATALPLMLIGQYIERSLSEADWENHSPESLGLTSAVV